MSAAARRRRSVAGLATPLDTGEMTVAAQHAVVELIHHSRQLAAAVLASLEQESPANGRIVLRARAVPLARRLDDLAVQAEQACAAPSRGASTGPSDHPTT